MSISTLEPPRTGKEPVAARRAIRPPTEFCLPEGYVQRASALTHDGMRAEAGEDYWNQQRIAASAKYQFHVYRWAAAVIRRRGLRSVLDVGCGPGTKLGTLVAPECGDVEGIDQESGVMAARRQGSPGRYTVVDLESPEGVKPWRTFDMVICADVLEHLLDPDPAMELIRRFCGAGGAGGAGGAVMLSTPCRARLRGRSCMTSDKPEHVREWTREEFVQFVRSRGFDVVASRMFPADDAAARKGWWGEMKFRMGRAETSPRRCHAVLCRPRSEK